MKIVSLHQAADAGKMGRPCASSSPSGLLRFITAGSVDDGKSTLIGRLLYDTDNVPADQLEAIRALSQKRGFAEPDLSLLTDGLQAEREQGITIDVAYRYIATARRKFIIGDAPGHEQYTRNMVTAASTADLAILLVDARKGIVTQTRRHAYLAHLLGIRQVVLAINKMDLASWSQEAYTRIVADFANFATRLDGLKVFPLPISALTGDNIALRSEAMPWHHGPTLIEHLEAAPALRDGAAGSFRLPVQRVARVMLGNAAASPGSDDGEFRGYQGMIASGELRVGDTIMALPSARLARIRSIRIAGRSLEKASRDSSIIVELDNELDISRGDMLADSLNPPRMAREVVADVCWLSEEPLNPRRRYLIKHTTRTVGGLFAELLHRIEVNTLEHRENPATLEMNDIARVRLRLQQPLFIDAYAENRTTGSFIVIDETTLATVGGGVVI